MEEGDLHTAPLVKRMVPRPSRFPLTHVPSKICPFGYVATPLPSIQLFTQAPSYLNPSAAISIPCDPCLFPSLQGPSKIDPSVHRKTP